MKKKNDTEKQGIARRSFLKLTGISSLSLGLGFPYIAKMGKVSAANQPSQKSSTRWKIDAEGNRYFIPRSIKTDKVETQGLVTAKVDNLWRQYPVREFDNEFHEWWINEKSWYYDQLLAFFSGETNELVIPNGGHHHPMLSTYGQRFCNRGDSDFHLNNAVKGFTLIPKAEYIDEINTEVDKIYATGNLPDDLFKYKQQLYFEKDKWDKTRFATLELYSGRPVNPGDKGGNYGFNETKTFQNIMANPMSTLTYMGLWQEKGGQSYLEGLPGLIPEWTFKGFCWLIAHHNPDNSAYEKKISSYVNDAHCRYHGGTCDIATNLFLVVEEFNTTPSYDPDGRGRRAVPPFTYENETAFISNLRPTTTIKPLKFLFNIPLFVSGQWML